MKQFQCSHEGSCKEGKGFTVCKPHSHYLEERGRTYTFTCPETKQTYRCIEIKEVK